MRCLMYSKILSGGVLDGNKNSVLSHTNQVLDSSLQCEQKHVTTGKLSQLVHEFCPKYNRKEYQQAV